MKNHSGTLVADDWIIEGGYAEGETYIYWQHEQETYTG